MTGARQAMAVRQALNAARPSGGNSWTLPVCGHVLNSGIHPICAPIEERLIPIGTALTISRLGIVASAYHNIHEALKVHPSGDRLREPGGLCDGSSVNQWVPTWRAGDHQTVKGLFA